MWDGLSTNTKNPYAKTRIKIPRASAELFAITGDTTSTTITFADAASKQLVIDAICKRGSFNPANEKGQTAEEFFNSELAQILSDAVYQHRVGTAVENAVKIVPKDDLPTKEAAAIKPIKK